MVSDEALMKDVRAGSVVAFQTLYDRHHRTLFTFFLRSIGDTHRAEDLLQETFLRVFAHRQSYRPTAAFKTWLFTVARNLLIDHVRQRGQGSEMASPESLDAVADPAPTPLQLAEAAEVSEQLQTAILQLPPSQREVLLLNRLAGLGHEEIAEIIGVSAAAVRVTLHRALRRLAALLESL